MKKYIFVLICISMVYGQFRNKEENIALQNLIAKPVSGLLDMDRITVRHSYSMSYASFGKNSLSTGEYVAQINYRIADPLNLQLELGAYYIPYSSFALEDGEKSKVYLKSATLDWKISKNFKVQARFQNILLPEYSPFSESIFNNYRLNQNP